MYWSGVRTGTGIIHPTMLQIQLDLLRVRSGCSVGAAGAAAPGTAGRPVAALASLAAAAATWGSGLLFPQVSEPGKTGNRTPQFRNSTKHERLYHLTCKVKFQIPGSLEPVIITGLFATPSTF